MRAVWPFALALAIAAVACGGKTEVVPRALLGRWVSDDARYQGRSLGISQRALIFASDQTHSENYAVHGVETNEGPDGAKRVTLAYGSAGVADLSLRLRLFPTAPPTLQIGDRDERWTRIPGSEKLQ